MELSYFLLVKFGEMCYHKWVDSPLMNVVWVFTLTASVLQTGAVFFYLPNIIFQNVFLIFLFLPAFVVGIPVFRAILLLADERPDSRLKLNPLFAIFSTSFSVKDFLLPLYSFRYKNRRFRCG